MELCEVIKNRRSIRKYKSGVEIPQDDIYKILEAAMMAPSACNTRCWEFLVLKSDDAKKRALKIHPYARHLENASIGIVVSANEERQNGIAQGFFPQDCGAAIQNMLLKSYDLGYGSCWCGIYPREDRCELFKNEFGIDATPVALVVIGVADEEPQAKGFFDEDKVKII